MNILNSFDFELPTKIEYGVGIVSRLCEVLAAFKAGKVLVVTDNGIEASGLLTQITEPLSNSGLTWEVFDGVEANPKDNNVQEGAQLARRFGTDCLVAVGGGSPIDCAKAICVTAIHGGAVRDYAGHGKAGLP